MEGGSPSIIKVTWVTNTFSLTGAGLMMNARVSGPQVAKVTHRTGKI
jgi:hypothetical protein